MLYVANCLCEGAVQEMESSHGRVERGPLCIMIDTQTFPYGEMVLNSRVTAQLGVLPRSIHINQIHSSTHFPRCALKEVISSDTSNASE